MNILVTGKYGYIANAIVNNFHSKHNITAIGRDDVDLQDRDAVDKWFHGKYFDWVIHTANVGGSRLSEDLPEHMASNIDMFMNIYRNNEHYGKLISFGSGAENEPEKSYYGLSKYVISRVIRNTPGFYNIRIYGVFDENEIPTRFIKANILRYINKEPIQIHSDRQMDFIYMKDLMYLVESVLFLSGSALQTDFSAVYNWRYKLSDIAHIINELGDRSVDIIVHAKPGDNYSAQGSVGFSSLPFGLHQGIKEVYSKLLS